MNRNTPVTKNGRNSLHWFLRYRVHKVFGSLPATKNLINMSMKRKYMCDQNRVKFPSLIFSGYSVHKIFGSLPAENNTIKNLASSDDISSSLCVGM